jgi:hypothetical protein
MILQILVGGLVLGVAAGVVQTLRVERRPSQQTFRGGKAPKPLPEGFWRGSVTIQQGKNWRGKVFDRAAQTGINRFADGERYPFKMYVAPGLRDRDLRVLRIDYNVPGNPWWLRLIVDEVVQTEPGHYLGKVHLAALPGLTFTATYFELNGPKD